MPFDFPSNPVDGQTYANFAYDINSNSWKATGTKNGLNQLLQTYETTPVISGSATVAGNMTIASTTTVTGRTTAANTPAFLAQASYSDVTFSPGQTIQYPNVIFNIGGHYNSSTGIFTAPYAARYLFTYCANGSYSNAYGGVPRAYFLLNGGNIGNGIHLRGFDVADSTLIQREQTIILDLAAGDYVRLWVQENRWDVFMSNFFMGYQIG